MKFEKLKVFNGMLYYRKINHYYDIFCFGKIPTMGYWNFTLEDDGNVTEERLKDIQNDESLSDCGVSGDDWEELFEYIGGTKEDLEYIMSIPDME